MTKTTPPAETAKSLSERFGAFTLLVSYAVRENYKELVTELSIKETDNSSDRKSLAARVRNAIKCIETTGGNGRIHEGDLKVLRRAADFIESSSESLTGRAGNEGSGSAGTRSEPHKPEPKDSLTTPSSHAPRARKGRKGRKQC